MYGPWKLVVQIGFEDKARASAFEKYQKAGAGRAFAKKFSEHRLQQDHGVECQDIAPCRSIKKAPL
jgi:hypothetical protein